MASTTSNRSRPINFDVNPSPETFYHFPASPSEPGKFDFYRVHLNNHPSMTDSKISDNYDAPTLSVPTTTSSITNKRWTPFADIVSSDQSTASLLANSSSSNSFLTSKSQTTSSSVSSNTNSTQKNETIQSVASSSSLTDVVKNAMNRGHLSAGSNQIRRPASGTTLSSKDLNHLSPQSM